MLSAKAFVSLFFIHFQCVQIIRMGYTFFNSVDTRIQFALNLLLNSVYTYLRVVFAFTYSISAFITIGNLDLQLLFFCIF